MKKSSTEPSLRRQNKEGLELRDWISRAAVAGVGGNAAIEGQGALFTDLTVRLRKRKLDRVLCFPLEYGINVAHYRRRKTRKAERNWMPFAESGRKCSSGGLSGSETS